MREWIEHDGKGIPVPGDTKVLVRFRDGDEETGDNWSYANYWDSEVQTRSNWDHSEHSAADIVAYRIYVAKN